jgi:riboflavin synthase
LFTGLVLGQGRLTCQPRDGNSASLTVTPEFDWEEKLDLGESVAVSGVCLTVETISGSGFTAFASRETLAKTTLDRVKKVNLERALKLNDRLGGHLVSGHVDGCGLVKSITPNGSGLSLAFSLPRDLEMLVVPKGSVTVDGVSLTVNKVQGGVFTVQTIPATLARTTLADLTVGQEVNLETDLLGKYVQKLLNHRAPKGITWEQLAEQGF